MSKGDVHDRQHENSDFVLELLGTYTTWLWLVSVAKQVSGWPVCDGIVTLNAFKPENNGRHVRQQDTVVPPQCV